VSTLAEAARLSRHARRLDRDVPGMRCRVCESPIRPGETYTWSRAVYREDEERPHEVIVRATEPSEPVHLRCA